MEAVVDCVTEEESEISGDWDAGRVGDAEGEMLPLREGKGLLECEGEALALDESSAEGDKEGDDDAEDEALPQKDGKGLLECEEEALALVESSAEFEADDDEVDRGDAVAEAHFDSKAEDEALLLKDGNELTEDDEEGCACEKVRAHRRRAKRKSAAIFTETLKSRATV